MGDRTAAKDNKVRKDLAQTNNITTEIPTSDDNELQKDQQEQTNTEITHEVSAHDGSTNIESVLKSVTVDRVKEEKKKSIKENSPSKSQVEKNPKHIDDEPPKRIVSPRYRKTDFLKFKNRLRRKKSPEKQQRKKSNKSPQKQRQDGNNKSHEKEQIPHTKESPTTHRPGSQSPLKQRRFIKSPTKQRPRSKELVVSTDFDYDKNSKTSATKTPTTTAQDGAAVPSAKTKSKTTRTCPPSSSDSSPIVVAAPQKHNLADIRSRIRRRRRTKKGKEKKESSAVTTTTSTKDSGASKVKMSATKIMKSFPKTKTTRTERTTVEDRNDSELSSKDRDQFYDAIASNDDNNNSDDDGGHEREDVTKQQQQHDDVAATKEIHRGSSSSMSRQQYPEDQDRDFPTISHKESNLSTVMSLD